MSFRAALVFTGTIIATSIVHALIFGKPDDHDITQFWIFAALVTILQEKKAPTHD